MLNRLGLQAPGQPGRRRVPGGVFTGPGSAWSPQGARWCPGMPREAPGPPAGVSGGLRELRMFFCGAASAC